jgi:hypothetical protein
MDPVIPLLLLFFFKQESDGLFDSSSPVFNPHSFVLEDYRKRAVRGLLFSKTRGGKRPALVIF